MNLNEMNPWKMYGQRKPVWFLILSVDCFFFSFLISDFKLKQIKKIKNKRNTSWRNFSQFFFSLSLWSRYLPSSTTRAIFHECRRRLVCIKMFYNSRALKCMLLFDVCLNYSTRWIIWNCCACAVHKIVGHFA